MGPRRCNIEGCKSVAGRQQHRGVTFHTFPPNPIIRQNWLVNCRFASNKPITKSVLICSRHFRRVDFQPLKNNKYLLKTGSEPTIFPWTPVHLANSNSSASNSSASAVDASASSSNDATKDINAASIADAAQSNEERIVNQILSEAIKSEMKSPMKRSASADVGAGGSSASAAEPKAKVLRKSLDTVTYKKAAEAAAAAAASSDPSALFRIGAQLDAKDFKGVWHAGEVAEVDQVDREVLIHFDNTKLIEEWIPMNSSRLRARQAGSDTSDSPAPSPLATVEESILESAHEDQPTVSQPSTPIPTDSTLESLTKSTTSPPLQPATPLPGNLPVLKKAPYNYVVGEKCMAKWTDSRRWRATVQTVLDLDYYDILFDDGYTKRCHAKDMSKIKRQPPQPGSSGPPPQPPSQFSPSAAQQQRHILAPSTPSSSSSASALQPAAAAVPLSPAASQSSTPSKPASGGRKINPPLPIPKFDLASLNLLPVPKDGEWCCNWVNDTPIGAEGYLEGPDGNRRPTVLVEDWRLPAGWTKHLYQRSSVSGKWDVVLVGPTKKRFRSKNDVKVFLDEHGLQYNPDVYDFSIHKRRAKDLGLFVFTEDYKEAQQLKQQQLLQKLADQKQQQQQQLQSTSCSSLSTNDLLNQSNMSSISSTEEVFQGFPAIPPMTPSDALHSFAAPSPLPATPAAAAAAKSINSSFATPSNASAPLDEGYVFVGSLKVQIHDNLFRCPEPTCNKNFRKENHLQIHVKHYHDHLAKQIGECLNMAELAYIRTTGELPPPDDPISSGTASGALADAQQQHQLLIGDGTDDNATGGAFLAAHGQAMDLDTDYILDQSLGSATSSGGLRTSTPNKSLLDTGASSSGVSHASAAARALAYPKKYKKNAKSGGKLKKMKLKNQHRNCGYTKPARNVRQLPGHNAAAEYDYDGLDDGEYQDSDYVPDGLAGASVAAPAAVRSNRLKFLSHPPVLSGAAGTDPNAALAQPQPTDVYVDENGEVIKLVRMRQEEIINCKCMFPEEDGLMIQCELCLTWQHGRCHGYVKESAVPDKYVCYICQNPQNGRPSMRFVHDQEWLYEGRLPVTELPKAPSQQQQQQQPLVESELEPQLLPKHRERFDMLKHSHTLTGNLLELKRFMHSLQVKINIAENKDHPKMYLWARKWEKSSPTQHPAPQQPPSIGTQAGLSATSNDVPAGIVPLLGAQQQNAVDHKDSIKLELSGSQEIVNVHDPTAPTIDEVQVINDLMSNADAMKHIERAAAEIAKTEIKSETEAAEKKAGAAGDDASGGSVKQEDEEIDGNILAGLLTSPGGTNIDLVGVVAAADKQEHDQQQQQQRHPASMASRRVTPVSAPQPEAAIDPAECQLRLLDHIQKQQMLAMTRLQSIEAEIIGLEAMDEHAESVDANDNFGSTKRQIFQLICDLSKIRKLAAINLTEFDMEQPRVSAAPVVPVQPAAIL